MVSRVNNSVLLEEREFRFIWMAWEQNTCRMEGGTSGGKVSVFVVIKRDIIKLKEN